jgi:hypothetical protein
MSETALFEAAAAAMLERGLTTQEQVHAQRVELHQQLGLEPPPAYVPPAVPGAAPAAQPAPSSAAALGGAQPAPAAPGQAPEAQPVDPMDAAIFAGPSNPAAYNFGPAPAGVQHSPEQELAFRSMFHEEGIPTAIGDQIGRLWHQAAAKPPTPVQLELSRQTATVKLSRMWGDDFERNVAVAQAEVTRMAKGRPEIREMLDVSGLGNDHWIISSLYNLARARGRG